LLYWFLRLTGLSILEASLSMFAIEARDLVKVYSGNVGALNGVDLRVE
jgi:hypothetical protein